MAGTVNAISSAITMRPPYLSVQMPSGTRISEPVTTGVAEQTVKANVLTISTDSALRPVAAGGTRLGEVVAMVMDHSVCMPVSIAAAGPIEHPSSNGVPRGPRTMGARRGIVRKE